MTCPSAEGNRNALLALHFGGDEARTVAETRAHIEGCEACREYLATLADLGRLLTRWQDDRPPQGMGAAVVARAIQARQERSPARPRSGALPLLAFVPVIAAFLALIRHVAAWLPALSFWPDLDRWPTIEPIAPFAVATLALLAVGGLAALAAAPALMLETRRQET